jgi:opacity protein-like surface antigen
MGHFKRRQYRHHIIIGLLIPAGLLAFEHELRAQEHTPNLAVSASAITGLLVGGSDDFLDSGYGVEAAAAYRLGTVHVCGRTDLGYLDLSDDNDPFTAITADNSLVTLFVGPDFTVPVWRFEPFARAFVGFAANLHESRGVGIPEERATDWNFAWGLGIGLRVLLQSGTAPLNLEVSGRFIDAGMVEFARARSPDGDGPSEFTSDIRMLVVSAGLRLGIPGT